jgi:hypothetical protein
MRRLPNGSHAAIEFAALPATALREQLRFFRIARGFRISMGRPRLNREFDRSIASFMTPDMLRVKQR